MGIKDFFLRIGQPIKFKLFLSLLTRCKLLIEKNRFRAGELQNESLRDTEKDKLAFICCRLK